MSRTPAPPADAPPKGGTAQARMWRVARQHTSRWVWGFILLGLTNAAAMAIPQLVRRAIDDIKANGAHVDAVTLRNLALLMIAFAAGGAVVRMLSRIHIFYAARDVEMDLRNELYAHLTRMPASFFQRNPTGDLMSRATNDLTQVRLFLGPGLLNIVNTVIAYAAAIPLLAMLSVKLTVLTLAVYPPSLFLMRATAKRLYQRNLEQQQQMGRLSNFIQESLAGAHVVRAFGREQHQAKRFEELNQESYEVNIRLARIRATLFRLVTALGSTGILLAVFFGARDVLNDNLTVGELVAAVEYMALLAWPTFALGWVLSMVQRGRSSMERIDAIMREEPTIRSGGQSPVTIDPSIATKSLTITYGERKVLRDVTFEAAKGRTIGIVGAIGSGKTTLVRALLHLTEVDKGQIFVGGHDVVDLDLVALRSQFGYVSQTHTLFSKTLAENVAFGQTSATTEQIMTALTQASFERDLAALPSGLETPVGERGIMLSGGQKQRASIARALLMDPPILILDDALSSVDTETEQRILGHIRRVRAGKTTLIVAHRVTAVQHADEIIVLDNGQISERGTHKRLVAMGGTYARMARRQELERQVEEAGATSVSEGAA
jgi:ATP-binding cassette subfamily B multidrug efflux pump